MKADHAAQLRLLELQSADTELAQLAHRRGTLAEAREHDERVARRAEVHAEVVQAEVDLADVGEEQRKLENEVDVVRQRAGRDRQRLQAGGLPAKELESLQHEVVSLARRQSALEDDLLEVMERQEEADKYLAERSAAREALDAEIEELAAARDAAFADIDAAVTTRSAERSAIAEGLPADLLALYERAAEHGGGVGAAMLRERRCEGCRIELSGAELTAVRAAEPDLVVRCEGCRRILVRTAESGL